MGNGALPNGPSYRAHPRLYQPFVEPCSRGVIDAESCSGELGRGELGRHRGMVLAACVLASSMAFIDGTALPVALPRLRADFGADLASVQWVLNGYMLALASLTLIGGALADVYGKARMLRLGCVLFALASAACALAPSPAWLIAARVAQGVAAAIVTPASLALIGATYPRAERNRAIGVWAAASALTTAGGPVLGGWLTETFGWPSVFWINPPLALVAVVVLLVFAPKDSRDPPIANTQRAPRCRRIIAVAASNCSAPAGWTINTMPPLRIWLSAHSCTWASCRCPNKAASPPTLPPEANPASIAGAAAPPVAAKTALAPANDATVAASEVASVRTCCRSSLKPISTRGRCLMSQPAATAQDAAISSCAKKLMRARSIPATPNSLTAASNSTSLCSAPMTSRNSLTIGIP